MELGEHSRNLKNHDNVPINDRIQPRPRNQDSDTATPEHCGCCFTLRGVAISSIAVIVAVAILIFVLDFTILEVHRRRQVYYYERKHEMFQDGGSLDTEPTFSNTWHLKTIDLHQVEADVSILYQFMTTGYNLEVIRLRNLKLKGKLPDKFRESGYTISGLREFVFESNQPIGPRADVHLDDCDECIVEGLNSSLSSIRQLRCIAPLLFYINTQPTQKLPMTYHMLMANITINIYGRYLLKVIHEEDRSRSDVTTMFNDCDALVYAYSFPASTLSKLAISGCTLNATTLAYNLGYLTQLTLDNVTITGIAKGQRWSQLFQSAINLEQLIIKVGQFKRLGFLDIKDRPEVMLSDFPKSLKTLVLEGVVIKTPEGDSVQNLTLDTLRLSDVIFENQRSLELFGNGITLKRLAFRQVRIIDSGEVVKILQDSTIWIPFMNKMMEKAEWIWLENPFYRYHFWSVTIRNTTPGAAQIVRPKIDQELPVWKSWLRKKGMDDLVIHDDPALKLIKIKGGGQESWEAESSHDGSPTSSPNSAIWFHFLKMGTFIREDLWNVVDW